MGEAKRRKTYGQPRRRRYLTSEPQIEVGTTRARPARMTAVLSLPACLPHGPAALDATTALLRSEWPKASLKELGATLSRIAAAKMPEFPVFVRPMLPGECDDDAVWVEIRPNMVEILAAAIPDAHPFDTIVVTPESDGEFRRQFSVATMVPGADPSSAIVAAVTSDPDVIAWVERWAATGGAEH